ncbi:MAG: DUF6084 family protein [Byssovorax sp.]
MPDLAFEVTGAAPVLHAAQPILALDVAIRNARPGETIHALTLHAQVRIEPQRRRYSAAEQLALADLFGAPSRWEQTLKPLLWAQTSVAVPRFTGATTAQLPLPCTLDFAVGSARYAHGLDEGVIPLLVLFSGTVFHAAEGGALQIAQVPWTAEARFGLPIASFRETLDHYFPGCAPLLLRRDVFERLHRYRALAGFTSWEQALESLLPPEAASR